MQTAKNLLLTVGILLALAVAYASFWILVLLLVGFILYHIVTALNDGD
jgi:hypothetical protein